MNHFSISLKPWKEVSGNVGQLNPELYKAMEQVAAEVSNCYLYEAIIPFGKTLMRAGKPIMFEKDFFFNNKEIEINNFSPETFLADFSNQNDHPLTLVQNGEVEIYELNSYKFSDKEHFEYSFPLNVIGKGGILGSFGATDFIYDTPLNSLSYSYSYSAQSGRYCVYPLLPQMFVSGKKKYVERSKKLFKELGLPFDNRAYILKIFPELLSRIYSETNQDTKLLIIPDLWIDKKRLPINSDLRSFVAKVAWVQSKEIRLNDQSIIPIIPKIDSKVSAMQIRFMSELIVYLMGALEGKRLVMKVVESDSQLHGAYLYLKDKLQGIYDPIMFHFDFLKPGEWGIFPIMNFPTLNPIGQIKSGANFLEIIKSEIDSICNLPPNCTLQYYFTPMDFIKEHFDPKSTYSQFFLTRVVLKIQL